MDVIQIIVIAVSICFLLYISYLIVRGKLREEYSIIWIICTIILIVFSIWRKGLDIIAKKLDVIDPPNLLFTGAIFMVLVYLLHLSVVVSKLQKQNKILAQELALMKQKEQAAEKNTN